MHLRLTISKSRPEWQRDMLCAYSVQILPASFAGNTTD